MKYKIVFICCLSCTLYLNVEGKDPIKRKETQPGPPDTSLQVQLLNERISELVAERINKYNGFVTEELATVDEFVNSDLDELLAYESVMFPADELYGFWDSTRVNPYNSRVIDYPDSFTVNCKSFVLPIDVDIKVTSNFGVRGRSMHNGIDLKVQKGDTIRSAFSGKVRIKGYDRKGYGNYLVLRHSNGLETVYGHLSKFIVTENEIVQAGQPIGLGGNTGRSTGTHLHFETRFLGQALNPAHLIDFENGGVPHNDYYVLYKGNFGKNVNIYTSTAEQIVYHRVQKGETLSKIALQYRTTVGELCRLNGLTTKSILRVGQALRCGTTIAKTTPKATETVTAEVKQEAPAQVEVTSPDVQSGAGGLLASIEENKEALEVSAENTGTHLVKKGETLFSISKLYQTSIDDICRLNGITEKDILSIGQTIRYTGTQPVSAAVASKSTATVSNTVNNEPVYYRIKEGDTLSAIALKHGITINQLCDLNNITRTTILRIGRTLRCS